MTSSMAASTTARICIATIGAAHGVGGDVRLWSHTVRPEDVMSYGPLQTADGKRTFEITSLRPGKGFLVARIKGISDRNAAEALRNIDLYITRAQLPVTEPEEFYHADLIGLHVDDSDGKKVGTVIAVHDFGGGDILEIAPLGGGETLMHPFSMAAVPTVDIASGRIVIVLPQNADDDDGGTAERPRAKAAADPADGR